MTGTIRLLTINKIPNRIQSWLAGDASFMLVNPDIANAIFIGNDPGSQLVSVPPLGSITLDTSKHDVWVSTNGAAYIVTAYLLPNGSNWVPSPAQVAAQINALGLAKDTTVQSTNTISTATNTILGTPAQTTDINAVKTTLGTPAQTADVNGVNTTLALGTNPNLTTINSTLGVPAQTPDVVGLTTNGIPALRGTVNIGNGSAQSLTAASTTVLIASANLTKPSFELIIKLNAPAGAGTVPFGILNILWQDSNTGLQVGAKSYVLTAGNGPTNFLTYYISGPCRGNQIVLNIINKDPAQTFTLTWALNQTSHAYTIDRLLQPVYAALAPIGFSNPAGNPTKGLLFASQPSIGPSSSTTRLCAASNAKCKISIDNGAQANGCAITLNTPAGATLYDESGAGQSLFRLVAAAGLQASQEWQMPNGPVNVTMINQTVTNTITPSITIQTMEY